MTDLQTVLDRHRDDVVPTLRMDVPIDRLLDASYLHNLDGDLKRLAPHGFERLIATPRCGPSIPDEPGVYLFVWSPQLTLQGAHPSDSIDVRFVLYVGKAGGTGSKATLRSRYHGEYRRYVGGSPENLWVKNLDEGREDRMKRWLSLTPLEYWYAVVEEEDEISSLEARLISLLGPPLNTVKGPRLRRGATKSAF